MIHDFLHKFIIDMSHNSYVYEKTARGIITSFIILFSFRDKTFAKASQIGDGVDTFNFRAPFSGPPVVLNRRAQETSNAQFEDSTHKKKPLDSEYLQSAFPCAFTAISPGFRHATLNESHYANSLRVGRTYLWDLFELAKSIKRIDSHM